MKVKVTQFLRPDGRIKNVWVEIHDECRAKYLRILALGCHLTAEVLSTGRVAQAITFKEYGDYDMEITSGDDVQENIDMLEHLIFNFDEGDFLEWRRQRAQEDSEIFDLDI